MPNVCSLSQGPPGPQRLNAAHPLRSSWPAATGAGNGRLCRVAAEDIAYMISEDPPLNPRPGACLSVPNRGAVVPEWGLKSRPDCGWLGGTPPRQPARYLVNHHSTGRSRKARPATEPAELPVRLPSNCQLGGLVKILIAAATRSRSSDIVRHQTHSAHGVRHLRRPNLRIIRDAISMHESTVTSSNLQQIFANARRSGC